MNDTSDLLKAMLERRKVAVEPEVVQDMADIVDENPPIDAFTEAIAYFWRRYATQTKPIAKKPSTKPEAAVLRSCKLWLKKCINIDTKRVSVGAMRTAQGFVMNFGGVKGESDLILTPHKGQPFERQIHVEVKRPDVVVDGKKIQRAGKQSEDQKSYQERMEERGDAYTVVTSVKELRDYLESLGFTDLPKCK
jgi:hypothetical protein